MDELLKRLHHILGNHLPAMNFRWRECIDRAGAIPSLELLKELETRAQEVLDVVKKYKEKAFD